MTAAHVLNSQQSGGGADAAAQDLCRLASGAACSLRPTAAMQLRVVCGRAWVTLGGGMHGWREEGGDLTLQPGQSLRVAAGQHAVVEPLGREPLRYQWRRTG
ncbi:MAG: DUF2917 domain-containing protein [Proteobacteria bacterium]|nr:DUF2917 domain-containing protein [Pseudomonadota bacterium]